MLTPDQEDTLLASLFATAEAMQQQLTPAAGQLMVQDLKGYDEPVLTAALQAVRREGGRFTVASVLKHVEAADGRPAPNEAWAIALQSFDETETVLMTPEIQQAAAAAAPVFDGDKIGARMTFLATYERLVNAARQQAVPATWSLSLGSNAERRALAIEEAQRLGRLPAPAAQLLLEQHALAPITPAGRAIVGLLAGPSNERLLALTTDPQTREALAKESAGAAGVPCDTRERLNDLRKQLRRRDKAKLRLRDRQLRHEREEMAQRRASTLETIKELEETHHA
ncbi:hypothetical protein FEA48_30655 [Pseudomonas nitroreducens]|uniref:Uncharacterized protein n=1 Tax=Pseudomonas nitroreducens TaxID=46680 RepID=A0A5R8ZQ74_PSENT|nr:hypothetical protein [Pseudomonas nitroreducens]TLP68216.1 hypothetical protein FEA48_30655 [Pseudomonas nitroreducens]